MNYGNVSRNPEPIPQDVKMRVGEILVDRLHRLAAKGYRPILGKDDTIGIRLRHPGKAPNVELWSDGQLVNETPTRIARDEDQIIIGPDDPAEFDRFLAAIPRPTFFQRLQSYTLGETSVTVLVYSVLIGTIWALSQLQ